MLKGRRNRLEVQLQVESTSRDVEIYAMKNNETASNLAAQIRRRAFPGACGRDRFFSPATCGGERTSQEIGLNGLGGSPADFIESPMKGCAVRAAKKR